MRLACEAMIHPTEENWLDVIKVASSINSDHLIKLVKTFLCKKTSVLSDSLARANQNDLKAAGVDLTELFEAIMQVWYRQHQSRNASFARASSSSSSS